jgi:hypothetical protein
VIRELSLKFQHAWVYRSLEGNRKPLSRDLLGKLL